jgi:hypothetical protein
MRLKLEEVFPMKYRLFGGSLAAALLVCSAGFAAELKSGPQVDETIPGPFHPLNCNGPMAGKKFCQV